MKSKQIEHINTTAFLAEVVEGCVLGDATLRRTSASAFFRMTQCKKRTDFLSVVAKIMREHHVLVKFDPYADGKFDIRTPTHWYWKAVRDRFYPDNVKVIPENIVPTKLSLLFFYLCDGYYMSADSYERYYGKSSGITKGSEWCYLSTYGFTWADVETYRDKIAEVLGFHGVIYPQRQAGRVYPRLVFRGAQCANLLAGIYELELVPDSMKSKFPQEEGVKESVVL